MGGESGHSTAGLCSRKLPLPGGDMSEIDWSRYPFVAENDLGRRWLQIQCDLGLAQNTVEAYGRGLEEYLRFVRDLRTVPTRLAAKLLPTTSATCARGQVPLAET